MNDIVKIKSLPFIVLASLDHCGADYVANLFFGHEQILKVPALLFFRKIRILRDQKNIDLIKIKDNDKIFKILKKDFFLSKRLTSYNFNLNEKQEIPDDKGFKFESSIKYTDEDSEYLIGPNLNKYKSAWGAISYYANQTRPDWSTCLLIQ